MVRPYVPGITLRERLLKARLEPQEALNVGLCLFSALKEVHAYGVLHRDIRPANVIVNDESPLTSAVLTGFSLGCHLNASKCIGEESIEAALYHSPEDAGALDCNVEAVKELMLPDPNHLPVHGPQLAEVPMVAFAVVRDFLPPEGRQFVSPPRVSPAMPKITVDEHGKPFPWKDDIRRPGERPDMLPEPEPSLVECRTNRAFEIGIAVLYLRHAVTTLPGRQIVHTRFRWRAFWSDHCLVAPSPWPVPLRLYMMCLAPGHDGFV